MAEHMEVDGETNVPPAAAIGDLEVESTTPDGDTDERLTVPQQRIKYQEVLDELNGQWVMEIATSNLQAFADTTRVDGTKLAQIIQCKIFPVDDYFLRDENDNLPDFVPRLQKLYGDILEAQTTRDLFMETRETVVSVGDKRKFENVDSPYSKLKLKATEPTTWSFSKEETRSPEEYEEEIIHFIERDCGQSLKTPNGLLYAQQVFYNKLDTKVRNAIDPHWTVWQQEHPQGEQPHTDELVKWINVSMTVHRNATTLRREYQAVRPKDKTLESLTVYIAEYLQALAKLQKKDIAPTLFEQKNDFYVRLKWDMKNTTNMRPYGRDERLTKDDETLEEYLHSLQEVAHEDQANTEPWSGNKGGKGKGGKKGRKGQKQDRVVEYVNNYSDDNKKKGGKKGQGKKGGKGNKGAAKGKKELHPTCQTCGLRHAPGCWQDPANTANVPDDKKKYIKTGNELAEYRLFNLQKTAERDARRNKTQ